MNSICRQYAGNSKRRPLALLLVLSVVSITSRAMINLDYTPVELVNQAQIILQMDVSARDKIPSLSITGLQALQGRRPKKFSILKPPANTPEMEDLK